MKSPRKKERLRFICKEFPTHVAKTNNKVAPNKMLKINNQAIYNGYINRFTRNIVIGNMHRWLEKALGKSSSHKLDTSLFPVTVTVNIYTVKNHGSISMRSGTVRWKPAKASYKPNWDIDNLATIWIKAICDVLTKEGIIPDDNISYIKGIRYNYFEVEDIKDRKIEIIING